MRKELLDYLLGALDEHESRRVEAKLARDARLRAELESLRRELDALQAAETPYEPAGDLLDQTCDLVEGMRLRAENAEAEGEPQQGPRRLPRFRECRGESSFSSRWSRADVVVSTAIALVLAAMFLPAIANSRFQSGVITCQRNLQVIGAALAAYSDRHEGRFPEIPLDGNRAAAGIFGPILIENHYLIDDAALVCPGSTLAREDGPFRVPRQAELDRVQGPLLRRMLRSMGGSYGYSLGYVSDGSYHAPKNRGRCHYALMSDAPSLHLSHGQSDNHAGRGQNVLFEDMHVQFFPVCDGWKVGDAFFRNHDGLIRAGVDGEDSVIGTSAAHPLAMRP